MAHEALVADVPCRRSTAFGLRVGLQPGMYFQDERQNWKFRCYLCHEDFCEIEQLGPGSNNRNGWVPVCKTCIDAHNAAAKEAARE